MRALGGNPDWERDFASRRHRRRFASAILGVAALLALGASPAMAKGDIDFGDAPDGAKAGYPGKPKVVGHFPSKLASGGPRHAKRGALRLGPTNTGEADSRQVDRDRDDGAGLSAPKPCRTATLTTALRGSKTVAAGHYVYVNAWFDWNRDGDWADPSDGCAAEWAVRNLPVPASSVGGVRLLPIKLKAGKQVRELWYRVTVTLDEVQIDTSGHGRSTPYLYGETEDYLQLSPGGIWLGPPPVEGPKEKEEREEREEKEQEEKEGKFSVRCVPATRVIPHGASTKFGFLLKEGKKHKSKKPIFGRFPGGRKGKGFEIKVLPSGNQRGVPPGYVRARVFRYKSKDIDPPTRIQRQTIRVVFTRGRYTRVAKCTVFILHVGKARQKKGHKLPPKIKPVRCEGACSGKAQQPPPGVTLTEYTEQPGDTFRLHFHSTRPLERVTVPLDERNPPTRDPPFPLGPFPCELRSLTLQGGPAALDCPLPSPFQVDSFFDIVYRIEFREPVTTFRGTIDDAAGNPIEGFEARSGGPVSPPPPPGPIVGGTGVLAPGPEPQAVNFKVTLDLQNTALEQFAIQVPPGFAVTNGEATGFSCEPGDLGGTNRALVCNGPVANGVEIQGGLQLDQPRPDQMAPSSALYAAGGGTLFGPFSLSQNPDPSSGGGAIQQTEPTILAFNVGFDPFGALNSFMLDLTLDELVIQAGQAMISGEPFTCEPVDDPGEHVSNALLCSGQPIANLQPIQGSITLNAPLPPTTLGADLFGNGPSFEEPLGPFAVGPPGP